MDINLVSTIDLQTFNNNEKKNLRFFCVVT